jgi:DNA-3-methyladenine glycosylase II
MQLILIKMWNEAEKFFAKDKYLGLLVEKYGPCRIKKSRQEAYFDDVAASIVGQQLSGKAADAIYKKVKKRVGKSESNSLLSPAAILAVSDEELRLCGLSWAKVNYLKDLSQKVNGGVVNLKTINESNDEDVIAKLTEVKGVGRWTAEMFLIFSLAHPDVFPVDDLGIHKGMEKLLGKKLTKAEMLAFSLRWKPYRTVASWYIWRELDD